MRYKYKRSQETFRNCIWPKNENSKRIRKCQIIPIHLWLDEEIAVLKIRYVSFLVDTTELQTWDIDSQE